MVRKITRNGSGIRENLDRAWEASMSEQPQWQFAGSVPENYERYLVPTIFAPWADDLVEAAALQPGHRVLDIACGTGIVARAAARRLGSCGNVIGLDLSAPMLAAARTAAAAEGVTVEWREGSAVKLPLPDGASDIVFCQQGLQFFPDRPAALREMHRVLMPGGRLVLSVWREIERSLGFDVLAQVLTRHISPAAGALMTSGPFGLGNMEQLRSLVAGAGFKDIDIHQAAKMLRYPSSDEFVLRYSAGSALVGAIAGADDNARAALLAEIGAKLQSCIDDQGLAFPIESNIVIARR
jgi:ubiquinone/menaquinone biosynthesis C-methylase UbiE